MKPNIDAFILDSEYNSWGGWSNQNTDEPVLTSLADAVEKIKNDPEDAFFIIDADNYKIYVSDIIHADIARRSAEKNYGIYVPDENVFVGFPETDKI